MPGRAVSKRCRVISFCWNINIPEAPLQGSKQARFVIEDGKGKLRLAHKGRRKAPCSVVLPTLSTLSYGLIPVLGANSLDFHRALSPKTAASLEGSAEPHHQSLSPRACTFEANVKIREYNAGVLSLMSTREASRSAPVMIEAIQFAACDSSMSSTIQVYKRRTFQGPVDGQASSDSWDTILIPRSPIKLCGYPYEFLELGAVLFQSDQGTTICFFQPFAFPHVQSCQYHVCYSRLIRMTGEVVLSSSMNLIES